jgi:hypothetical protein
MNHSSSFIIIILINFIIIIIHHPSSIIHHPSPIIHHPSFIIHHTSSIIHHHHHQNHNHHPHPLESIIIIINNNTIPINIIITIKIIINIVIHYPFAPPTTVWGLLPGYIHFLYERPTIWGVTIFQYGDIIRRPFPIRGLTVPVDADRMRERCQNEPGSCVVYIDYTYSKL